jgi:ribonuclease HI
MKKQKFYVVWRGRNTGIYNSWDDCLKQVDKFEEAQYKSFNTLEEAEKAFAGNKYHYLYSGKKEKQRTSSGKIGNPVVPSISVDAAWNTKTKMMEYQGVFTQTGDLIFKKGPYEDATNNIGEFLAIVHALALLKQKNNPLPVYSDSATAIKWVKMKKANTKLIPTEDNAGLFEIIERAEAWLQNNTYPNAVLKWETKMWGEIPADFGRK